MGVLVEENLFGTQMGRKNKQALMQLQLDDQSPAAGSYNKNIGGVQPTRLGRQGGSPRGTASPRTDMHMIMTPRDDDPPPPTQITPAKKNDGTCRVPSEHCEKISAHCNEELLRYEMVAGQDRPNMRSESLPLELSPRTSPRAKRNPMNHEGWEEPPRRPLSRSSPRKAPHATAAQITNQIEMAHKADNERTQRLAVDKHFADLCLQAEEVKNIQTETVSNFLQRNHHSLSDSM